MSIVTNMANNQMWLGDWKKMNAKNDNEFCMIQALAEAVEEYKEKTLRGLNAMTEDDIQERLADFKARFKAENGTPEEMEKFEQKLGEYERMLRELADQQPTEMLLNFGGSTVEEVRPPFSTNPQLQQQLLGNQTDAVNLNPSANQING